MKSFKVAAVAALLFSAGIANAALYQFQLTGSYNASWQFDSNPTPDEPVEGAGFVLFDVGGTFPGASTGVVDLTFYTAEAGGGLQIDDFYAGDTLLVTDGVQLYTGTEDFPTFLLGTFNMTEFDGNGTYVLTVTEVNAPTDPDPSPVPEPASGAILLGGLGALYAARKRRQNT